jgi:hypothetical protein
VRIFKTNIGSKTMGSPVLSMINKKNTISYAEKGFSILDSKEIDRKKNKIQ